MTPHNDNEDDDEYAEHLTLEEIEEIYDQFPEFNQMTPQDALIMSGFLLDMNLPVPVDLVTKAHSGGLYFAH